MFKMLLLLGLLHPHVYADGLDTCHHVLTSCEQLVDEQDKLLALDKEQIQKLENKLVDSYKESAVLPWWLWSIVGVAVGVSVGTIIHH